MGKYSQLAAVILNFLAAVWLVAWTVYVAFDTSGPIADLETNLAILLIPAAIVLGISYWLERLADRDFVDGRRQVGNTPHSV